VPDPGEWEECGRKSSENHCFIYTPLTVVPVKLFSLTKLLPIHHRRNFRGTSRGGSTLRQEGHVPQDSLVAPFPDSKAGWKNAGLYEVHIFSSYFFGFGERIKWTG